MDTNINLKRKQMIVNEEKIKRIGIKKPGSSIKTTSSTGKMIKQNLILKKGLQKSQTIESTPKSQINISTPKSKNSRNAQSVNLQRSSATLHKKQLSPQEKQLNLFQKKKNLQKQLQKVRIQLNQQFDPKKPSKSNVKTESKLQEQDQEEAFKRVNHFLRKIKKQKQQLMLKKKKSKQKQLNLRKQQQNELRQALLIEQGQLKEERRKQIEQKMAYQKSMAQLRQKINKRSNSLIQELLCTYKTDPKDKSQRIDTVQSQKFQQKTNQNESYSQPFRSVRKKYEISPFLSKVFKEQAEKKKQEQLKIQERKRVHMSRKEYAEKTRAKTKMSVYDSIQTF